jgi:hypothetical protein
MTKDTARCWECGEASDRLIDVYRNRVAGDFNDRILVYVHRVGEGCHAGWGFTDDPKDPRPYTETQRAIAASWRSDAIARANRERVREG